MDTQTNTGTSYKWIATIQLKVKIDDANLDVLLSSIRQSIASLEMPNGILGQGSFEMILKDLSPDATKNGGRK